MATAQEPSSKRGRPNEGEPQHTSSGKRVRKRTTLACEECRLRKRRCDGGLPACSGCMKRRSTCVYASEIQAKAWQDSMIQSLKNRLDELTNCRISSQAPERHISDLDNIDRAPGQEKNSQMPILTISPGLEGTSDKDAANDGQRPQLAGSSISSAAVIETAPLENGVVAAAAQSESPSQPLEPRSFEKLMKPIDQAIDRKCNGVSASSTWPQHHASVVPAISTRCTCLNSLDTEQWCLPLRRHADGLVAMYFSRVHRVYPILHQRTFRRQYERLWESGCITTETDSSRCVGLCKQKSQGRLFPAIVHAIFALATLFEGGPPEQNATRADAFFCFAQKIDLLDILDDEVGIELVQLGLLMGFYLQSTERFSKCWNITGLTIRMAQNMGLQLSLGEARKRGLLTPFATQSECEMQIRVWYGCVLLDREISMSFGRALMIATGGSGIRLPEPIDDDRLSDEVGKWNVPLKDEPSLLDSYIYTIKLYDILGQVLDREELKETTTTNSSKETSAEETSSTRAMLGLDTKILQWRDSLPAHLQYEPSAEECEGADETFLAQAKRLYTRFLHVRVLILRPALEILFEKQQHQSPRASDRSLEARLQDLMLMNIAAQCVICAETLVKFLDAQIQSKDLKAWWYNLSYLHTCGSTILMGQVCTFDNSTIMRESLLAAWELCLQCLSSYTRLSSIARKSFHLLQESAKRLLSNSHRHAFTGEPRRLNDRLAEQDDHHAHATGEYSPVAGEAIPVQAIDTSNNSSRNSQPMSNVLDNQLQQQCDAQSSKNLVGWDLYRDANLDDGHLDVLDYELWNNDSVRDSYWPFMPYLSQLVTLPPSIDASIT